MPSTSVSREIEVDRLSAQLWLPRRALMAWDAGSGRGTHGRDQAVGGRALHRAATSDQAHGRPLDHRRSPPALHQRRPAARNHLACRRPPPAALDRYLVHLPSYARRMPRCSRSACAWRMRPTPERARCAAPDSYARRLSAFRWQDAACMERRCRLSRCELIVKLAEPKLFVTITNVTIGSDANIAASSPCCPATARLCAVRHRFAYLPPSTPCPVRPSAPKPHSPTFPHLQR